MAFMLLKVCIACLALAAVCWICGHTLLAHWPVQRFLPKAAALLLTVILGAVTFLGCGLALRIEELSELAGVLRRRFARRAAD
jgi:peptidoglycan biosynthesis protein MviN/MurJ (putative lipid II flippase)